MKPRILVGGLTLWALAACQGPGLPAVSCASTPGPSGPSDTLAIRLTLGARPRGGEADVLVRVDGLDTRGAISFTEPPPPSAAAVSLALTPDATFQGCLNPAPGGFRLHAAEVPVGRLWIRVSSNRPVVIQAPRLAEGAAPAEATQAPATLTVLPGSSGRARWPVASRLRSPE